MPTSGDEAAGRGPAGRTLLAACVGNAIEWYDFAIFAALGVVITPLFISTEGSGSNLLTAFALYAVAFVVRPVGAVFFGRWADTRGRRGGFVATLLLMTLATTAVGLLPTETTIGLVAPVALLLLRAVQGLAAGGELGVAGVFVAESAPRGRRGAFSAWHTATLALGLAAGLATGAVVSLLPSEDVQAGWWRAPFLFSLPVALVGIYLRRRGSESVIFVAASHTRPQGHVREIWANHRRAALTGFAMVAAGSLAFNTFFVFVPNHLAVTTDRSASAALLMAVLGLLVTAVAALALGALSDRVGRRPVVLGSAVVLAVGAVPMMLMTRSGSLFALAIALAAAGVAIGGVLSIAQLAEMFPTSVRGTGLGLTAGLATAVAGGTAPLVAQALVLRTGSESAPGIYVAAVAATAAAVLWTWPEGGFTELDTVSAPGGTRRAGAAESGP